MASAHMKTVVRSLAILVACVLGPAAPLLLAHPGHVRDDARPPRRDPRAAGGQDDAPPGRNERKGE